MQKSRSVAAEFRHTYGYEIPVDYLAARLADQAQVYTQVCSLLPAAALPFRLESLTLPGWGAHCVLEYYYYYYTLFLPRGKVRPADRLQLKAATILPLVGLARSKQDPIDRGHGAQYLYRPPPAGARNIWGEISVGLDCLQVQLMLLQ